MLAKTVNYLDDLVTHGLGVDKTRPTFVNLSVTNKCNARCVMCDIWKYESFDLGVDGLRECLRNPYLSDVTEFGLTGGEPFLRRDFVGIVDLIQEVMPKVKFIGVTSNGFMSSRMSRVVPVVLSRLRGGVTFQISVSLDGIDDDHNASRGVDGVFDKVDKTVNRLLRMRGEFNNLKLYFACTISNVNARYAVLKRFKDYAQRLEVKTVYRLAVPVDRIYNKGLMEQAGIRPGSVQSLEVIAFLQELMDESPDYRNAYYKMMIDFLSLKTNVRTLQCKEKRDGVMLDSNGDVYVCSVSGKKIGNLIDDGEAALVAQAKVARACVRAESCSSCFHDHMSHIPIRDVIGSILRKMV